MAGIKVKAEHAKFEIGFNNKYAALGDRDDNHILLAAAKANNNRSILDRFEEVTDEDIQKAKEDAFNKKQAAKVAAEKEKNKEAKELAKDAKSEAKDTAKETKAEAKTAAKDAKDTGK